MSASNRAPDDQSIPRGQANMSNISTTTVPQITLTEAANNANHEIYHSPTQSSRSYTPKSPPAPSGQALPLTRDLLQKKNKLDKLLHEDQNFQRPVTVSSFSSTSAVDERVTAGLGISTPSNAGSRQESGQEDRSRGSARARPVSTSIISEGDRKSQPSPRMSLNFLWNWETSMAKSSTDNSQMSQKDRYLHSRSSSISSHNKSSIRRSNSLRTVHDDTHHYAGSQHPRIIPKRSQVLHDTYEGIGLPDAMQTHWVLSMLYNAAARVIHTRAPESSSLQEREQFDILRQEKGRRTDTKDLSPVSDEKDTTECEWRSPTEKDRSQVTNHPPSYQYPHARSEQIFQTKRDPMVNPLQGNTLFIFGPTNPIRLWAWKLTRSRNVELFMSLILLLHWFLMACVPIYSNDQKTVFGGQWTHYPILAIQIVYTVEALCKIIAYGLLIRPNANKRKGPFRFLHWAFDRKAPADPCMDDPVFGQFLSLSPTDRPASYEKTEPSERNVNHKAFLGCFGNSLDLISIISYWVDFAFMMYQYQYCSMFKALGALRPLRLMSIFPGTAVVLKSLETGLDLLMDVAWFIIFAFFLFALVGLVTFQGVFSRRCYAITPDSAPTLVEPASFCSGYYNGTDTIGPYNPQTNTYKYPGYSGFICPSGQICLEDPVNNPNNGFVNYDTIFSSFLSVYTFTSLELWTELMYQNMDGDSMVAALYYCLGVYVVAFILIFLLYAVIASAFARVRMESKASAFSGKKKNTLPLLRATEVGDGVTDEPAWMYEDPTQDGQRPMRLRLRRLLVNLVKSRPFFYFGGFLVLLNLIFMCMRSTYADESFLEMLDNAETGFTFVFALEIIIRMAGSTTWLQFWTKGRNQFDLFLVIATCVIQLPVIQDSYLYKYLTFFQVFRLYRLFICIPRVQKLLHAALGTGESIINVLIFLVWATALCCPVFMQMFGGDFVGFVQPDDSSLRCDTFWQSFLTLIMLYSSESWTAFLYNAMESQPNLGSIYGAITVCLYFAFGRYIMAGLYIAVILENFEMDDDYIKDYQIKEFIQKYMVNQKIVTETIVNRVLAPLYVKAEKKSVQIPKLPANLTVPMTKLSITDILRDPVDGPPEGTVPPYEAVPELIRKTLRIPKKSPEPKEEPLQSTGDDMADDYDRIIAEENRSAKIADIPAIKSLYLFSNKSKFRYWCKALVGSSSDGKVERRNVFNWFIMACVLLSISMVILDEPSTRKLRIDTIAQSAFDAIDLALGIIFVIEILIRIVADGLILPSGAYLRNYWNQLDFCVVVLNFITLFLRSSQVPHALSTVRSLRILRIVRYFRGVKDVFIDLFYAFPLMIDAFTFTVLVLIPYAAYGVNIFGGRFWLCNDDSVAGRAECVGEYEINVSSDQSITTNIYTPRTWNNPEFNFYSYDNFPLAFLQMFTLTSTEGWVDSMFSSMSTPTELNIQPNFSWDSSMVYHSLFYVTFVIISHGTVQLFIGVIIEKFKQRSGITSLTTTQRQYGDLMRQLAEIKPTIKVYRSRNPIRGWCYDLVAKKHGWFNRFMMIVIVLNICVIASEFQDEPDWLSKFQDYIYFAFIVIFVLEIAIKLAGLGWKKWIKSKWNWYDALIASSSLILLVLRLAVPSLWTVRVERYCLILAAFRLGQGSDALQTLYHTIGISLPSIIRVSAVFMLVMCLFAMLFMEFFGLTKYGPNGTDISNFRNYGNTLLLLVRMTTGEGWNSVMTDYLVTYPNCVDSENYLDTDCGAPGWAYFLFNFFYIVCTHIFLNLFTAVIISNFEYAYETRSRFTLITKNDMRRYKHAWAEVDPTGSGYIQKKDVATFLHHLSGRFRLNIYDEVHSIRNLQKLGKTDNEATSTHQSESNVNRTPGKRSGLSSAFDKGRYAGFNYARVNRCLASLDTAELQRRRKEYNVCYLEITKAATPKGISFGDVLTIMSYRFVNIEEALTIDPLITRLEKLEKLNKIYASEKARGVFLTMIERKRFLHRLWQKRNEEEISKLGVVNGSGVRLDANMSGLSIPNSPHFLNTPIDPKRSPVPRIIVENMPAVPSGLGYSPLSLNVPVSPMSAFSVETHQESPFGADSLAVASGTYSGTSSPCLEEDDLLMSTRLGGHSPLSPLPIMMSPNLLMTDGNAHMSPSQAENLMDSLKKSVWSDMLKDEDSEDI